MKIQKLDEISRKNLLEDLLKRSPNQYSEYESVVAGILADVNTQGDAALFSYTKKFDKAEITADNIQVTQDEIREAYEQVGSDRIMWGLDAPFHHPTVEMQRTIVSGLTDQQLADVFYNNAKNLLKL